MRARNGESGSPYLLLLDHSIPLDPDIERAVEDSIDAANGLVKELTGGLVEHILEPVAASDFILWNKPPNEENRMGNFVTDAMRFIVEEKTGRKVDFAFQGSGIIRHPVIPGMAAHSRGFISFYDITEAVGLGRGRDGSPGYPWPEPTSPGKRCCACWRYRPSLRNTWATTTFAGIRTAL